MKNITAEQLLNTIEVILIVFAAIITIDKVIDIFKKWKMPGIDTERKLSNDKLRLDEHEASIKELKESNRVLCSGVVALLDHELHNGNSDQMQKARDGILDYLQSKI